MRKLGESVFASFHRNFSTHDEKLELEKGEKRKLKHNNNVIIVVAEKINVLKHFPYKLKKQVSVYYEIWLLSLVGFTHYISMNRSHLHD